eukprot:TRINITY_DN15598_c0_g1_i1.p1 TRINITY_DN15598_c0_g1~~TRINITY_DN15598_c0_g1_i1.p1  ORF type:complete len:351 (+),score=31.21 TRINITY_DN15598_c0_g1_i1:52-1104(+)
MRVPQQQAMADGRNAPRDSRFFCPLTRKLMDDPVLAPDGVIYERKAIQEHLEGIDTSPFDDKFAMSVDDLEPVATLRSEIKNYQRRQKSEALLLSESPSPDASLVEEVAKANMEMVQGEYYKQVATSLGTKVLIAFQSVTTLVRMYGSTLAQWVPVSGMNFKTALTSLRGYLPRLSIDQLNFAAGAVLIGAESSWYAFEYFKGNITGTMLIERLGTALLGAGVPTLCSFVGSLMWPGVGTILGSIVGGAINSVFSRGLVLSFLDLIVPQHKAAALIDLDYQRALGGFNLTEGASREQIMHAYHEEMLRYHPDKAGDEPHAIKSLVRTSCNFETIKSYRQRNNKWPADDQD